MASLMQSLIGKKPTPEELVKKWRQQIRSQERELDKSARGIETEEAKVKRSLKLAAKRNDVTSCRILAKEVVRSRKARDRIASSKAQLNSLNMSMQHQLATTKIAGTLQKSTAIMSTVNNLIKLPEISSTMQEMSAEMMKAGIIDEMMEDTLENAMGDEDGVEEEAEEEVNKVLFELTDGRLGEAPGAVDGGLEVEKEQKKVQEEDIDSMAARLSALRA
ncbi:Snf7-domain-containing protein [Fimicolochytrium jonesii]|uniref:Snf7-domain-containing protein n=1 Tax=Fimicolochytrium jonesii TaxID=1396493 RepID=UPI0022FECC61|nr:Snf7-domain-containing protein [Fimicolochytrium jonesii]KAI8816504.1 Snf7-domain-containing protein [Fimicolochytrium jonesii]